MLKKISVLALAGLFALPSIASAGSANDVAAQIDRLTRELAALKAQMATMQKAPSEDRELNALKAEVAAMKEDQEEAFEDLDERSEAWDLSSRFKFFGDFRAMGFWNNADVPAHYTALDVATGVVDVLNAGSTDNINNLLGAFGMNTATPLATFAGALAVTPQANFEAAAVGAGLTATEANDLAAIFFDPSVGALLGGLPAGTTVGDVTGAFADTERLVGFMKNLSPAARARIFSNLTGAYNPEPQEDIENDTLFTNRFRLNMRVKATENVEFKARLAMYKAWGMQNNPLDLTLNGGPHFLASALTGFDGAVTRQPSDSALRVDRAFANWNNIGGQPIWFSIGRRPTSDGPPAQLRLGIDKRMATPPSYMDYPFDGLSIGYAYANLFGMEDFPGRIRFCYGRGFESGPTENGDGLKDVDFAGFSWDVYKKGNRFLNLQSFAGYDMFNVPDGVDFPNPIEFARYLADPAAFPFDPTEEDRNLLLDRKNMGNIYYSTLVYMDKISDLNYFFSAGWSRTDPRGVDELGTGLLTSWWDDDFEDSKDGVSVYAGIRYDMADLGLKLGLEYNYGTKNWIAFTPGHDDLYQSKLATRGHVYEAYLIYDLPTGEAVSKYAKTFIRLGYQHYEYKYTGSGFWLGEPIDIDDVADDPLNAQFYSPTEDMDNIYLSFDVFF